MARNQKVAAGKTPALVNAIVKGKETGVVVNTLPEDAEIEAQEGTKYDAWRVTHWAKVFRNNADDVAALQGYPKLVRHAKARLMGLDMTVKTTDWDAQQKKLYTVFCANHISPLVMFLDLAIGKGDIKGIGIPKVVEFLEGAGTLPTKIAAGRKLLAETLGTIVKPRGTKDQNAATLEKAEQETKATSASGNKLELDKMRPAEASIRLVQSALTPNDCIVTIQAAVKRLKASKEKAEIELGEKIHMALEEYFSEVDGEQESEQETDQTAKKKAAA